MKTKTPTKPKPKRVRPTLAEMKRLRQMLAEHARELAAVERERTQYRLMHEASLMLRSRPRKLTLWERLTGWGRPIQLAGPVTAAEAGAEKPEPKDFTKVAPQTVAEMNEFINRNRRD